jgi:uncharacterized repeat protein (TIGR02543 family)
MKKFTKILGFLGFFVTLAIAQVGSAWAVRCPQGYYWRGSIKQCEACPGHTVLNGVDQGVYCPGGDNFEGAYYDEGLNGCIVACGNVVSNWLTTPLTTQLSPTYSSDQCTGECTELCIQPEGCTSANNCYTIWEEVAGTATCENGIGRCVVTTECNTVTCEPCYEYDYNEGKCVPKSYKGLQYKCSQNGTAIWTDPFYPTYMGPYTVDPQNKYLLCNAPSGQSFAGWMLNSSYGPYQPGSNIPGGWPCIDEPAIFIAQYETVSVCHKIKFNDNSSYGGHPSGWPDSSTPGTHGPFYKKDGETKWYEDSNCNEEVTNPTVVGYLPWKENAEFTGYKFHYMMADQMLVFDGEGRLTQDGTDWTLDASDGAEIELMATYKCHDGFTEGATCGGNNIDVNYVCNRPVNSPNTSEYNTIEKTFNGDATMGEVYTIRSVGSDESNHQVNCSFPGYTLNVGYKWKHRGTNDEHAPGPMDFPWNLNSEQTFELDGTYWTPINYEITYKCGYIDGESVGGNDTTDNTGAYFNQSYTVANSNVYEAPFITNCSEPDGYTVKDWTLYCGGNQILTSIVTGDSITWTYDYSNCYFEANWAQNGFVIYLNQEGVATQSNPTELYTIYDTGVYVNPARTPQYTMQDGANSVTKPTKNVTVTFNGDGGTFSWDGTSGSYTYGETIPVSLGFKGFYYDTNPDHETDVYKYIDDNGAITRSGWDAGIGYQSDYRYWYPHWNPGSQELPGYVTPPTGYIFSGWDCNGTLYPNPITLEVTGNTTCTAQYDVACYEVTFNDTTHGNPQVTSANNPARYVKHGVTGENAWQGRWYMDSDCSIPWYDGAHPLTVGTPTKEHATFTGYYDEGKDPDAQVFGSNGVLTDDGQGWETNEPTTLYAQYTCDHMYHLMPDGSCGSCDTNEYWDPTANDGAGDCVSCATGTSGQFPYSTPPFNWSINQCYNYCGSAPGTDEQFCDVDPSVADLYDPSGFRIVDDVTNSNSQHKQIEFYGNYTANPRVTACDGTVQYCAYGFVFGDGDNYNARIKPMTAPVDFRNAGGTDILGTRYIFGSRVGGGSIDVNPSSAKVWSQIVGPAQKTELNSGNGNYDDYYYTYIIYPTYLAPDPHTPTGYEFTGYYYPQEDGAQYVENRELNGNNAQSVLGSQGGDSNTARNLYANYELHNYTLSYDCNCPDGVNCEPHPADQQVQYQQPYTPRTNTCRYAGHTFIGWALDQSGTIDLIEPDNQDGTYNPKQWLYTEDKTFYAQWANTCYEVTFDDAANGGRSGDDTNGPLYVKPGESSWVTRWYTDPTCETLWYDTPGYPYGTYVGGQGLLVLPHMPQMDNGHFIGYFDADDTKVFQNNSLTNHPNITDDGLTWTTDTDATLYAKYECNFPYHLSMVDGRLVCTACNAGEYYNSDDGLCHSCNADLSSTNVSGWTSRQPYNWSINQCYRNCGTRQSDNQLSCIRISDITSGIDQFVDNSTGTQISFYGNEFVGDETFNTCLESTGAKYCPQGLLGISYGMVQTEPIAALVNFHDTASDNDTKRWIMARRSILEQEDTGINVPLMGAFGWSQVVGLGQQRIIDDNHPNQTYIVYPSDSAPEAESLTGYNFIGYNDRDNEHEPIYVENRTLNSSNAGTVLNGLGSVFSDQRDLYAQYDCAAGYSWQNGECKPEVDLCQAQLPTVPDPHATMTVAFENDQCVYTITCKLCPNGTSGCYNHDGNQTWEITGPTTGVLPGTFCTPTEYVVTYDCGSGNDGGTARDTDNPVAYNETYTVLANGTTNGGVVSCSSNAGQFNGWSFNGNGSTYTSGNSISPWIYNMENPTLTAVYSECPEGYVLINNSQVLNQCMPRCSVECTETCPYEHADHCEYSPSGHSTEGYQNREIFDPDAPCLYEQSGDEIGPFDCAIIKVVCEYPYYWNSEAEECQLCPSGYHINATGDGCDPEGQYVINLNANIGALSGNNSNVQNKLYTIHNTGVYINEQRREQDLMTPSSNPLPRAPERFATVKFYLNCNSNGHFTWNGQQTSENIVEPIYSTFKGYYNAANGTNQYIDNQLPSPYITLDGQNAGKDSTGETWWAQWTPGTTEFPNNPTCDGYTFGGWYTSANGGTIVSQNGDTTLTMDVNRDIYAHWNAGVYSVNLDPTDGTAGSVTKLYEKYGTGWSKNGAEPFTSPLQLSQSERPSSNDETKIFAGFYERQGCGGAQRINANGLVVDTTATVLTDNSQTWYACWQNNNGPFKVIFKCDSGSIVRTYTVEYGDLLAPAVPANTACTQAGMAFSRWKPMEHTGEVNTIPAGSSNTYWNYRFGETFVPDWLGGDFVVTLNPNGGTGGVSAIYEQYGVNWYLSPNHQNPISILIGSQLPTKTNQTFQGYLSPNGTAMGNVTYNNGDIVWTLPPNTQVTSDETWMAQWGDCLAHWYLDNGVCKECPSGFQDNPSPNNIDDCYSNCTKQCVEYDCWSLPGVERCHNNSVDYPGRINYPGGTPCNLFQYGYNIPGCTWVIDECMVGYHLSSNGKECLPNDQHYIDLNSQLYVGNIQQGDVAIPSRLYTIEDAGVYIDERRRPIDLMDTDNNSLRYEMPKKYVIVKLHGNGTSFYWNASSDTTEDHTANINLMFNGFYENGNDYEPMIGANRYITDGDYGGMARGKSYTSNQTWVAHWSASTVTLPSPDRNGYEFIGWYDAPVNGNMVSGGDQSIPVGPSANMELWAHWKAESYDVTYSCGGGDGGPSTDSATYNGTYVVRDNFGNDGFIRCQKSGYGFDRWKFNYSNDLVQPNTIYQNWTYENGTFTANYEECSNGQYVANGICNACPGTHPLSDHYTAIQKEDCYKNCTVSCTYTNCPEYGQEGVLYCDPDLTHTFSGTAFWPSEDCNINAESTTCPYTVVCDRSNGYYWNGVACVRDTDKQHIITLNQNGGTGGQDKLYTIYQTNVYRDVARTEAMSTNENPLLRHPTKSVTVTFNYCDGGNNGPSCDNAQRITTQPVNLDLNGYNDTQSSNSERYISKNSNDGKYYITFSGLDAGKSYSDNNQVWYANWAGNTVSPWPNDPTYVNNDMLPITYRFGGWWTESQCGDNVSQNTTVDSNRTWYAHWCAQCPSTTIEHGTCTQGQSWCGWCDATITCDTGYEWNNTQKKCLPITGLKITYRPNGGTPSSNIDAGVAYGDTFTTLGIINSFTKPKNRLINWTRFSTNCSNLPQSFELSQTYTYGCNGDTTLDANWKECQCRFSNNSGVQSCTYLDVTTAVINNTCHPTVVCMDGYVNGRYSCDDEQSYFTECTAECDICPAGTYQNEDQCTQCEGNTISASGVTECTPCSRGYHANSDHTECTPNTITIDWDENGGQNLQNGQCTYDSNLTLEQAPQNAPEEAFLGWWLHNRELGRKNAGASVQCEFDTVGVYDGTSYDIQADWKHCECDKPLNPHVSSCYASGTSNGTCECFLVACDPGYNSVASTIYTCSPECVAIRSNVRYTCGDGDGFPPTPDTATYDEPYTVKDNTGCHKDDAPFVGWLFNDSLYAGGYVINPWTYTGDATFVAQYGTQCQYNEILINNTCVPCDCSYGDNSGVSTCNRYPIAPNNCGGTPTCLPGYMGPSVNCTGPGSTNCTATCTPCGSTQISVGNTCEDCTCTGTGATCGQLSVTNNRCNWTPQCLDRYIDLSHNCYGGSNCNASCTECPAGWISNAEHTKCIECDGGTYQNGNECVPCNTPGYTSLPGSTSVADCNIPLQYTIEYQANGGVNARTHIAGQPEYQRDLTYNEGFVTYDGTIFTKTDSVVTNWDVISGGSYTEPKHWYTYYETDNTKLKAHWTPCECDLGAGASSCGMLSTDDNTCNWTNPVCQDGYVSPTFECTGRGDTNCTLTCGQCGADEIIVDGVCVPCTCTAGDGAASCTPGSTSNNKCTATGQCSAGYGNDNGNANIECSGTNCVVSYNKCNDGQISNANCECVCCPENTYQDGNVCKSCPTGTTSPACSTSASACTVSGFTLVYRSNNGQNRTVRENYDYMQSFITKPGTTFAWAGHIMTQWDTAENTGTKTFADGYAELNRNYVYRDVANIILDAHWEQCTCTEGEGEGVVAGSCIPLSTNDNTCGCNATCNDGLRFAGCNCNGTDGTACSPVCEPMKYNAVYTCGSGTGAGYSESVAFGATYHIKDNVWCVKDKSTFAGWNFNGDNVIYLGGDPITWNYKTDREFMALWCPSCLDPADHCELLIPNPGECQVTCNEGYRWDSDQKKCIAKTDLRLTYQPNGGKPNQDKTDFLTYGQSFTTKSGTTYTKARHIMTHWNVESGGEHTFTAGIAQLKSPYTYKTDGDTVLSAQWQECADGTIVIGNECVACSCTEGAGVVHNSCSVQSTDNNLCTGTVECQDGYVGANVSCDGAQCTATCNACQFNEVSVNGECVECECTPLTEKGATSCGTESIVNNMCNWGPATCRLGFGYPVIACSGSNDQVCEASCTICDAGFYGDDGVECKPCPNGKTSYPGSTSINQCFIDPGSCDDDEHVEQGVCVPNVMECAAPDAYLATRTWNASIGTYGPCIIESCIEGYHILANTCVLNTCSISHGHGEYDPGSDTCYVTKCDPGYYESGNACVECENKIVDGDVAVSSYVSECEIAACMYQGQKYALDTKNNECVPICTADRFTLEDPDNPTGTIQWDERTKKCIRTCNPGYKMW